MMFFLLIGTVSGFAQVTDAQSNPQIIDSLLEISGKFADKGEFDKALEINTAAAALALKLFGEESAPYAKACFNIGMLLYHQDDPGAIIWYQKSLVIWEKVSGQESAVYAKNLYYLGNAHRYAGDNEQAKPFYLEALAIQEKILGKSDRARLKTLKNLASLYRDMGDTDGAETLYLEAKGIYINTLGTELDDYFELLNSLGRLYEKTENYFDLLPVAQEIVAFTQKKSGEESPQYAEALFLLGDAYKETWDLEKAQKLYQEGLDIFEKAVGKAHKTYAYAVNNLARVYLRTGDLVGAELRFVEAKDIYEKLEGKESKSYAHLLSNIAILYHEKGAYKKAIAYDTEALDIYAKRVGKQSHNYGNTLQNLAILYLDLGDFERAESLFKEAVQIFENLYGTAHPRYAHALRSLAQLNLEKGQIGNSAEILTKVLDVLSKTVGKHSPDYADALDDMAKLNMQQGNFKETEALLLESKDIMAKARGEEGPSYAAALSRLAAFYNHTNRFQEAAAYYVALNKLNRLFIEKSAVYTSEHEMLGYLQFFESDFAKFLSFTQAHPDPDLIRQNFDNALFLNGLVLQNAQILARAISNADSLTQDIYEKWQGCHRRLAKRYVRPIKEHKRIEPVEQEAEGYEKMLQLRLPEFQESRKIPHWQDVAKQLKSNEVALEFLHYRRYNPGPTDSIQYAALVLRAGWDAPKMVLLFEEKSLDSLLNTNGARKADFVAQVYAIPDRGVVVSAKAQKSLYELVWTPLEAVLHEKGADSPAIEKIYFSPSGLLHRINLAAVPISADSTLADRYHLVEMGSTRQVLSENNVAFQHQDAMLFGGITYALDTSLINDGSQEKDRGNQPDHISDQGARSTSWNYLPGTEKEVTILEQIIKDSGFQIQSFKGAAATEEVFKKIGSNGTPSPRILHLATHGFFFPDPKQSSDGKQLPIDENETGFKTSNNPLIRSGILMAGADFAWNSGKPLEKGMENGILTAYEISHMDLTNTELVVLSACETGLGDIEGNEGVFGLQRAFKIAGAKYLIMSLWQVPDKQTSLLMRAFYKNWLEDKMDIPEAFWAAQKALREIGLDPYQWAGFVLME